MMKVLQLVLNGEPLSFTVGATDWADACEKFSATYDWFDDLMKRKDIRISFQEVGK
jgi:hypothetical protein